MTAEYGYRRSRGQATATDIRPREFSSLRNSPSANHEIPYGKIGRRHAINRCRGILASISYRSIPLKSRGNCINGRCHQWIRYRLRIRECQRTIIVATSGIATCPCCPSCLPLNTNNRLVPMLEMEPVMAACAPFPTASMAITAATPITMPSTVRRGPHFIAIQAFNGFEKGLSKSHFLDFPSGSTGSGSSNPSVKRTHAGFVLQSADHG